MVRNILKYGTMTLMAIALVSCAALVDSPTGSISFAFPHGALSRSVGETYKVVIYYGLDRYDVEPTISGSTLTFTGLPTGDARIIVAKGTQSSDGFFYTDEYAQLYTTIVPGDNPQQNVALEATEFVRAPSLDGANVNGLATLDGSFYASTTGALTKGSYSEGEVSVADGPEVPEGVAVNSISIGKVYEDSVVTEQVWVNGTWSDDYDGGIMPWLPGTPNDTLDLEFSAGFGNTDNRDGDPSDVNVLHSGAFDVPDKDALAIVFQRNGGMGGVYLEENEFDTGSYPSNERPWIIDEINFDELLGDVVEEGTDFIKDFAVSESSAAYIITSLVTMKVTEDIVSGDLEFNSADDVLNSESIAYAPYLGFDDVCIDLGSDGTDEVIYLGTENGLYTGNVSSRAAEFFDGAPSLVAGTAGYYIKMVTASPNGYLVAFVARRGENPEFLIIVNNETDEVIDLRGLQGLPGDALSNLAWLDTNVLAVSGDRGLAVLDAVALFN
jgi:hypothetical protein